MLETHTAPPPEDPNSSSGGIDQTQPNGFSSDGRRRTPKGLETRVEVPRQGGGLFQTLVTNLDEIELDQTCSMRFWWKEREAATGLLRKELVVPDAILQSTHDDLAALAAMKDIRPVAITAAVDDILNGLSLEQQRNLRHLELLYRRLGWFAAFALYIEPLLRENYETIPLDDLLTYVRDPLWVVVRPGRLLRSRDTNQIIYRAYEFMPPGMNHRSWLQKWYFKAKLHLEIQTVNDFLAGERKVDHGEVQGLPLGYRSMADGALSHPYVYGWRNKVTGTWISSVASVTTPSEWERKGIWEYPAGLVKWVQFVGPSQIDAYFPVSPPTLLNSPILQFWTERVRRRFQTIRNTTPSAHVDPKLRNMLFARNQDECRKDDGSVCPYLECCWNEQIGAMPLRNSVSYIPNPSGGGL